MAILIGLTGSAGSGQSTVAAAFASDGRVTGVCSLDAVGHRLMEKPRIRSRIGARLGLDGFENMSGREARKLLGGMVFVDRDARSGLEAVMHPIMARWTGLCAATLADAAGLYVLEGALIFEMGLNGLMDAVVVVACDRETCLARASSRDRLQPEEAARRLDCQAPLTEKLKKADWVIYNGSGETPESLACQVRGVLGQITELHPAH